MSKILYFRSIKIANQVEKALLNVTIAFVVKPLLEWLSLPAPHTSLPVNVALLWTVSLHPFLFPYNCSCVPFPPKSIVFFLTITVICIYNLLNLCSIVCMNMCSALTLGNLTIYIGAWSQRELIFFPISLVVLHLGWDPVEISLGTQLVKWCCYCPNLVLATVSLRFYRCIFHAVSTKHFLASSTLGLCVLK